MEVSEEWEGGGPLEYCQFVVDEFSLSEDKVDDPGDGKDY